jgi:hypothetical protein
VTDHHDDLLPHFRQLATGLAATHRLDDEQGECLALIHLAVDLMHRGVAPDELPILDQLAAVLGDAEVVEATTGVLGAAGVRTGDGREQSVHALFTAVADRDRRGQRRRGLGCRPPGRRRRAGACRARPYRTNRPPRLDAAGSRSRSTTDESTSFG